MASCSANLQANTGTRNGIVVTASGKSTPNISDALAVLKYVVGPSSLTTAQQYSADVAPMGSDGKPLGNGVIDLADVCYWHRYLVGGENMNRLVLTILLGIICVGISGCGGGGGGGNSSGGIQPPPIASTATIKIVLSGSLNSNLSGASVTLPLPVGVTVATDSAGAPLANVVIPSGVTASAAMVPTDLMSYSAPTATNAGSLTFVLASNATGGFGIGEFATVTMTVASGSIAPTGVIPVASFKPVDIFYQNVTGLTASMY